MSPRGLTRWPIITAGVLASPAVAAVAAVAAAAVGIGHLRHVAVQFGTKTAGASSALTIDVGGMVPPTGTTLPPGIRQTLTLPAGTRVDPGAARAVCHASIADLEAKGAEGACPAASRIGSGLARGSIGGTETDYDLGIYAFAGKLDFAAEKMGKPLKAGFFGVISGRTITFDVPTAGGTIAPLEFRASVIRFASSRSGRALVRTPPRCPRARRWTASVTVQGLTAASGGQPTGPAQTITTTIPCRRR